MKMLDDIEGSEVGNERSMERGEKSSTALVAQEGPARAQGGEAG